MSDLRRTPSVPPVPAAPGARLTKKDRIVAALRARIETGELERGTWIRQDSLAEDFDTSITPVREALRQLEAEGLLTHTAHRGVRVAEVDLQRVTGTYLLRRSVEPYAMQRAAMRLTPADLLAAERLLDTIDGLDPSVDGVRISALNRRFHFSFYARSGPASFVQGIEDLWDAFPWDLLRVARERVPVSAQEHRAMLAAVRSGDLDAIAATTALHVRNGYRTLRRHLRPDDADLDATDDPYDPTHPDDVEQ